MNIANNLIINEIKNKNLLVIKCGGSILGDSTELDSLIKDVIALQQEGFYPIIVHGGGADINQLCNTLNVNSNFINGLRVTTKEILDITQMTLIGKTNAGLVQKLNQANISALGLSGHDVKLLIAEFIDENNLGFVGQITQVNIQFLYSILSMGIVPVIAPLAVNDYGAVFNVNADLAASAIAKALQVQRMVLLSDIDGYYANYPDKNSLVNYLTSQEVKELLAVPTLVSHGMKPKLMSCLEAVDNGVDSAHIVNGNTKHSLLQVIENSSNIGTTVLRTIE